MRILLLTQAYPPFLGGSERYAQDLSTGLVARDHEVTVVTLWRDGSPAFEIDQGVEVHRVRATVNRAQRALFSDPGRSHAPPLPDPELVLALRRICQTKRFQIVHTIDWMVHSFLPLKLGNGAKLVLTLQDYSLICAKKTLDFQNAVCDGPGVRKCLDCAGDHYGRVKGAVTTLGNWGMRVIERRLVDHFIPVSTAVAERSGLVQSGLSYDIIPNFVKDDLRTQQDDTDSKLKALPEGDFLLFVGGLSRKKGVQILLDAYAHLTDVPPLVLIGYETAEDPVDLSNLPKNVILIKNCSHSAVMAAWSRSAIGYVPSVWPEPFGIVVLEGMLAGKAVIATNHGGIRDIIVDGESGILVPPRDTEALVQATSDLLRNPEWRRKLGEGALKRVEQFKASTVIPRIEDIYQKLVQNSQEL